MSDVIRLLERLVAYPTVSSRPILQAAAHIAERCEAAGFQVERFMDPKDEQKCTLLATIGPAGTQGLVLSGHMDVVPVVGQPWTTDPFVLTERDGTLVGRGSADMKGFIAATLIALSRIRPSEYTKELALIWTHDEEVGCKGSAAFAEALREVPRPLPKATLIGEPTGFQVLRMHPGHVAVEFETRGVAAHSSRPDLGRNAILLLGEVIKAVESVTRQLAEEPENIPELERPVVAVNIAEIEGGNAINIVPDRAVVRVGYRPLPGHRAEDVYERFCEAIRNAGIEQHVRGRILRVSPSMLTPQNTELEHTLCGHAVHSEVGAATFATDGGNLASLGLQPLIFGPGDINVAHKADEFIPIDQLTRSVDMIESIIRHHCCK